jgi:hypothetical protein
MMAPSSWISKFNMAAAPIGAPLGSLDVACDRPDHNDGDLRTQRAKSLDEIRLAGDAGFSPSFWL